MARKLASDKVLFVALVALSLFGCVMIYSASAVSAGETSGNPYRYLTKQIVALVLGGIAAFTVYRTDYRIFARPWLLYGAYAAALLLADQRAEPRSGERSRELALRTDAISRYSAHVRTSDRRPGSG